LVAFGCDAVPDPKDRKQSVEQVEAEEQNYLIDQRHKSKRTQKRAFTHESQM
jgi:hypothetical protein